MTSLSNTQAVTIADRLLQDNEAMKLALAETKKLLAELLGDTQRSFDAAFNNPVSRRQNQDEFAEAARTAIAEAFASAKDLMTRIGDMEGHGLLPSTDCNEAMRYTPAELMKRGVTSQPVVFACVHEKRLQELRSELAMANDAAAKGDEARQILAGMELSGLNPQAWKSAFFSRSAESYSNQAHTQQPNLIGFANEMINAALVGGDMDGGSIQDSATKHCLLIPKTVDSPCRDSEAGGCACAEVSDFPTECMIKHPVLAHAVAIPGSNWAHQWAEQFTTTKPVTPGAYWVRGFRRGEPNSKPALVEVALDAGHNLACNLSERNTEDNTSEWTPLAHLSDTFEWQGPLEPPASPQEGETTRSAPITLGEAEKRMSDVLERLGDWVLENRSGQMVTEGQLTGWLHDFLKSDSGKRALQGARLLPEPIRFTHSNPALARLLNAAISLAESPTAHSSIHFDMCMREVETQLEASK